MIHLTDLGWNDYFNSCFEEYKSQEHTVMRIIRENRGKYIACNNVGEFSCEVTGKFRFHTDRLCDYPAVGDWVVTSVIQGEAKAMIHAVLPRKSAFSRKVAGEITEEQVVAANIDTIFIVMGLDLNFNIRRIERYLSIAWESGAVPVVLLNKADLCEEHKSRKLEVEEIAVGVDVFTLSAQNEEGLEKLAGYIQVGKTVAFLGSSGVGKSTIINKLLGMDYLAVNEVNEFKSRGKHTTTYRELVILPNGGMLIDTPGMREIQVWGDEEGLKHTFEYIEDLALKCKYRDCTHENEPGCAVQEAIKDEKLDLSRFESYLKLKREYTYLSNRQTMKASQVEKLHWKEISQYAKKIKKNKQ